MKYILSFDQSTQGTKAILTDETGAIIGRADRAHQQIVNELGWVSHNLDEIYHNTLLAAADVVAKASIDRSDIRAIGISNQRETSALWNRDGTPLNHAVVWQCARAKEIAQALLPHQEEIRKRTGLALSPYFSAAKMAWLLQNTSGIQDTPTRNLRLGTIDSWLIYRLTQCGSFKTDYSNASRTQLFNIHELCWDDAICRLFGIPLECLPEVVDSNSVFGLTDLDGFLPKPIPIHSVLGDSHAALYGQGCHHAGMIKTTYGTGSSIMMNTGGDCVESSHGLVTSLAWGIDGQVSYVLEGNINYTGAVLTWLKDDVKLITSPNETEAAAQSANPLDHTILVPAFSGLSAPYWSNDAEAVLCNMSRTTGRNELIRAALDSIAFQITAVLRAMSQDSGLTLQELRVDGGPTKNRYLMQLQSDLSQADVVVPEAEELSALGAAWLAGVSAGIYQKGKIFSGEVVRYHPALSTQERQERLARWDRAVRLAVAQNEEK